jgi:hypothetical protein
MFLAAFVASLYLFSRAPASRKQVKAEPISNVGIAGFQEAAPMPMPSPPPPPMVEDPKVAELAESMKPAVEPEPEPPPPPKVEEPPPKPEISATAQDQAMLMRFFRDCLVDPSARAFTGQGKMDAQTRFACHLFLGGWRCLSGVKWSRRGADAIRHPIRP